jgi:hypothetical protein
VAITYRSGVYPELFRTRVLHCATRLTQAGLLIEIHRCSGAPHRHGLTSASLARVYTHDQAGALRVVFATVERPC